MLILHFYFSHFVSFHQAKYLEECICLKKKISNFRPKAYFKKYAAQSIEELISSLKTDQNRGLSSAQVAQAHKEFGFNAITGHEITAWNILLNQIKSPFIYLLIIIALINFILREPSLMVHDYYFSGD